MPPLFNQPLGMPDASFRMPECTHTDGDGLTYNQRLSEPCPVKRVAYDMMTQEQREERYGAFSIGVATLGHLLEKVWIHKSFIETGEEHYHEAEIMWDWGISHIDCFVPPNDEWWGLFEVKSTSKKRLSPTSANYEQVKRQLYALRLQGMHDIPATIVVIGKSGSAGGIVGDPYPVSLMRDDIAQLDEEFDFVNRLTMHVLEHGTMRGMQDEIKVWCRCGKCVPAPKQPASEALFDLLNEYDSQIADYKLAVDWKEDITSRIKAIVGTDRCEIDAVDWVVKVARNGRLTIDKKMQ